MIYVDAPERLRLQEHIMSPLFAMTVRRSKPVFWFYPVAGYGEKGFRVVVRLQSYTILQ